MIFPRWLICQKLFVPVVFVIAIFCSSSFFTSYVILRKRKSLHCSLQGEWTVHKKTCGYGVFHPHHFCLKWWFILQRSSKLVLSCCIFFIFPASSGNLSRKLTRSIDFLVAFFFGWLGSSILHRHSPSIVIQYCIFKNAIFPPFCLIFRSLGTGLLVNAIFFFLSAIY